MTMERPRQALLAALERLEREESTDGPAGALLQVAQKLTPTAGPLHDELRGRSLGHPVHSALTDLPVGLWVSAAVLDLTRPPGHHEAARRLVALGLVSAVPTVITGLTDYRALTRPARRVAAVHAAANGLGNALMASSWAARRSGHHRAGVLLSTVGLAAAGAGALLGGHIALGMKEPAELP